MTTTYTTSITSKFGTECSYCQTSRADDGLYALYLPSEQGFTQYLLESDTADDVHGCLSEWADSFYGSTVEITVASVTSIPANTERLDADNQ